VALLNFAKQRQAVHLIHAQIAYDQIDFLFLQITQGFRATGRRCHLIAFAAQAHAEQFQQAGIIIYQQ